MIPKDRLIAALRHLCAEEGGPRGVAMEIGASAENLSQILAGTLLPSGAPRGVGPGLQRKLERRYPGWANDKSNSAPQDEGLPQQLRLPPVTVVPTIQWGDLMKIRLPETFRITAPDDSMAPKVRLGKVLIFSSGEAPKAGDGVLVSDADGNCHFRQYRTGRAGTWQAFALNEAFQELDSRRDGLTVLAVLVAEEGRWA